jgi:hypothetical protein
MGDEKAEIEAKAAEEQAIQTFKIKKLIASLERARGCVLSEVVQWGESTLASNDAPTLPRSGTARA